MPTPRFASRLLAAGFIPLALCAADLPAGAKAGAQPSPTNAKVENPPSAHGGFVFSLFPKSMQANPSTDLSAICEMTDAGRKLPVVTREHPATYIAHDAGFMEAGDLSGNSMPDKAALSKALEKALATNGFKPAPAGTRPQYALIFHWGTHRRNPTSETIADVLSRAMLVGGRAWAREFAAVLQEQAKFYAGTTVEGADGGVSRISEDISRTAVQLAISPRTSSAINDTNFEGTVSSASGQSSSTAGQSSAESLGSMDRLLDALTPMERFKRENPRNEFLVSQVMGDIYFVVITALDAEAAAKGKKVLLWRARMSVDAQGLSMDDALPALVANGAPFLGRDMTEVATMVPRLLRGKEDVKIGDTTVIDDKASSATSSSAQSAAPSPAAVAAPGSAATPVATPAPAK